jgi:DNA-binding transcriptional LysR family regulator
MLKPEHLVTLREVVRLGSFARAANRLGYTASAVSQQVSALERELGARLFERGPRAVVPTDAARAVLRHSAAVLSAIDQLARAVGEPAPGGHGALRVGIFPSLATCVLAPALAEMPERRRHLIRVQVGEPSELVPSLGAGGDLDLAFVYQVGQSGLSWSTSLARKWLGEDPFQVAYPRSWSRRPSDSWDVDDFVNLPWILHRPGTGDAAVVDSVFARWELRPKVVGYSDDFHCTLALVASGLGAAVLPRLILGAMSPPGVAAIQPPWLNLSRSIFGLYRPESTDPTMTEVLLGVAARLRRSGPDMPSRG